MPLSANIRVHPRLNLSFILFALRRSCRQGCRRSQALCVFAELCRSNVGTRRMRAVPGASALPNQPLFLCLDPRIYSLFEGFHRKRTCTKDLIVECPNVELIAQFL